ncbi:MAG: glycoside hydrolase family 92 protein [Bacilli bacterium]|nr:glycoside hydrolase family 92 protein [Bacilli bacterium]
MNYNELINFRWGSEPQGKIKRNNLAKKWMFIKPDVGNLSAAPQVPFSSFNVVPYYGGYPTGFSVYEYCAWGTPKKCTNNKLVGFTHFSFSGAGDLHHFHNYFLIKPSKDKVSVTKEKFSLNGFEIVTPIYSIKTNVNARCAYYKINSKENITIIPGFSGLTTKKYKNKVVKAKIKRNKNYFNIYTDYSFLKLYWTIKIIKGKCINVTTSKIVLSNDIEFIIGFSTSSFKRANNFIALFDNQQANRKWENCLKVFDVMDNNSHYKKLFYTALMFSLKKPYIYDEENIYDFATIWDVYKTLLPLIFLFYKKEAEIITKNMLKLVNQDGLFYHAKLFSSKSPTLSEQAICLMNISLSTAKLYGVKFDYEKAKILQRNEIKYYLKNLHKLDRTTYLLDLSDAIVAYYNAYHIDLGLTVVKKLIDKAFEKDKVYLDKKANYYEGNYSNYSFRVSSSTIYRLENKKKVIKALDDFFGFKGSNTTRFDCPLDNPQPIKQYMERCKRFEGLNNEPDMESMYLYSYFGLSHKQNEVINDVINNSFSLNNNGVPGNDDNGGLSSWLVFNLLGIFPVVGTNKLKIGLPFFNKIKAGNLLVNRHASSKNALTIKKVLLNNKLIKNNEITALDVKKGGTLDIYLK